MTSVSSRITTGLAGALAALCMLFGTALQAAPTLVSIAVTPSNPSILVGQTQTFTATGTFSDGSTEVLGSQVMAIAAGGYHDCALLPAGAVQCWGFNDSGQLGNGTNASASGPVTVGGLPYPATAITAGYAHTCALSTNGAVQCWGDNANGQLGNTTTLNSSTPVSVSGIDGNTYKAIAIAAGGLHTCAVLTPNGTVQCWGDNTYGELGPAAVGPNSAVPVPITGLSGVIAIAAGYYHTCALLSGGAVQCWGNNGSGQLGNGMTVDSSIPVPVTGIDGSNYQATAIAAGDYHTCALISDGTVQCWGNNGSGQLGNNSTINSSNPVTVTGLPYIDTGGTPYPATAIAAGGKHTCAVTSDGAVRCWGYNAYGQLGDGTASSEMTPVKVTGLSGGTAVAAGAYYTCALLTGGTEQCWGDNTYGQLGDGTTANQFTPVAVTGLSAVVWVSSMPAATIDVSGTATGQSVGTTTIQAFADGVWGQTTLTVNPSSGLPDLVVTSLTATPSPAAVGESVTLTAMVNNIGTANAGPFYVTLYKQLSTTPTLLDPPDQSCFENGGLAVGSFVQCSVTVTYTASENAIAWAWADWGNNVTESNESNNLIHTGIAVRYPNLRVISLAVSPTTADVGAGVTITATVENVSAVDAVGPFDIGLFTPSANPPSFSRSVGGLGPYGKAVFSETVTYPAKGSYQIWTQADTNNNITETSESDNIKGPVTETISPPDLVITQWEALPTSPSVGQSVTLVAYVHNQGGTAANGPFVVDLYNNLANAPSPSLGGDETCTIASLAANGTTTCKVTVPAPYSLPGTNQAWAQVNRTGAVVESDSTNNTAGPVIITVQ